MPIPTHRPNQATEMEPEIERIRSLDLGIEDVIPELNEVFLSLYGLTPWSINCGDCEYYADCLAAIIDGCEGFWGNELINEEDDFYQFAYHHITRYNGRYTTASILGVSTTSAIFRHFGANNEQIYSNSQGRS